MGGRGHGYALALEKVLYATVFTGELFQIEVSLTQSSGHR